MKNTSANVQVREKILAALMKIMEVKPLSSIRVVELTRQAGVSRMAFYRNYMSIEQILTDRLDEIMTAYRKEDPLPADANRNEVEKYALRYFEFMRENRYFVGCLLSGDMGDMLLKAITEYELRKWSCGKENTSLSCKIHLFSGGLYNLYIYWASRNFDLDPKDMAAVICDNCQLER